MVCLINYACQQRGLTPLSVAAVLNRSSVAKAERIVRCKEFKHAACGQDPASAYAPQRIQQRFFRPEWRTQGIAAQKLDRFGPYRDATLWINQFGTL